MLVAGLSAVDATAAVCHTPALSPLLPLVPQPTAASLLLGIEVIVYCGHAVAELLKAGVSWAHGLSGISKAKGVGVA